jgi:hypothetical protein
MNCSNALEQFPKKPYLGRGVLERKERSNDVLATWDIRSNIRGGKRNVENLARYVDKEEKT